MQAALHITTRVLPDKRIEFHTPELEAGTSVEVFVVFDQLPTIAKQPRLSMREISEALQGHRHFQTAEEVDQYLEEERNSWER